MFERFAAAGGGVQAAGPALALARLEPLRPLRRGAVGERPGRTAPAPRRWRRSSSTAAAALIASSTSPARGRRRETPSAPTRRHSSRPAARADGQRVRLRRDPRAAARSPRRWCRAGAARGGRLVRDHVRRREVAGAPSCALHVAVEARSQVHAPVGRAVERPDGPSPAGRSSVERRRGRGTSSARARRAPPLEPAPRCTCARRRRRPRLRRRAGRAGRERHDAGSRPGRGAPAPRRAPSCGSPACATRAAARGDPARARRRPSRAGSRRAPGAPADRGPAGGGVPRRRRGGRAAGGTARGATTRLALARMPRPDHVPLRLRARGRVRRRRARRDRADRARRADHRPHPRRSRARTCAPARSCCARAALRARRRAPRGRGPGGRRRAGARSRCAPPRRTGCSSAPTTALLLLAAERFGGVAEAVDIAASPWRLEPVSATFHGRDVFAPVARPARGGRRRSRRRATPLDPDELVAAGAPARAGRRGGAGRPRRGDRRLRQRRARRGPRDLEACGAAARPRDRRAARQPRVARRRYARTFADVARGGLLLYEDADGALAVAINRGRRRRRARPCARATSCA